MMMMMMMYGIMYGMYGMLRNRRETREKTITSRYIPYTPCSNNTDIVRHLSRLLTMR